jgi:hypothetical protein
MRALVLDPSSSKSSKDIDFPGVFLAILWFSLDSISESSIEVSGVKHPKGVWGWGGSRSLALYGLQCQATGRGGEAQWEKDWKSVNRHYRAKVCQFLRFTEI